MCELDKIKDKIKGIFRAIVMLAAFVCFTANSYGYYLSDPEVEIDGVRYSLVYYSYPLEYDDGSYEAYLLENETKMLYKKTAEICGYWYNSENNTFSNGDEVIPAFECYVKVLENNAPDYDAGYPGYDKSKDKKAQRYPYYTGEVWVQDSVLLPDLPNLREKKYHYVGELCKFNEELTFIRTPKCVALTERAFINSTGLKAVQIGTAREVSIEAFRSCVNLETVIFERNPYVYNWAFSRSHNIKEVVLEGSKLPTAEERAFEEHIYDEATLYVRDELMESVRNHPTWSKFKNVRDIEEYVSGVESINPDSAVRYEIYTLSGMHVRSAVFGENWRENLPAGVYIVKSSLGSVKKEYIK